MGFILDIVHHSNESYHWTMFQGQIDPIYVRKRVDE